jgi:hypothetical protein
MHMFRKAADFEAFEPVMVEAHQREPIRILACCILSNHEWVRQTVKAPNLEHTVRREGRPRKANRSDTDSAG